MAFDNLKKQLQMVMRTPLPFVRIHPLVFELFEIAYFAAAVLFLSVGLKGSLRDFAEQPEIDRKPWVSEFDDHISQFGFEFYFWSSFLLFFRFLIQRRWTELCSPIMFMSFSVIRFIVSGFTSPYLCDVVQTIILILLNSALMVKTVHRIFPGQKVRTKDLPS